MVQSVFLRGMRAADLDTAVRLHREVLSAEFLSSCGDSFLRRYYRAWMDSPYGVALCAVDREDHVVGLLLGSLDPPYHYRSMVRTGGAGIVVRLAAQAVRHPTFGMDLLRTRMIRYLRALARMAKRSLVARFRPAGDSSQELEIGRPGGEKIGEITHLLVDPSWQGGGIGRNLVTTMEKAARDGGIDALVLVTPPDSPARQFYERLGWKGEGEVTSASQERFVRYRLAL